MKFKSVAKQRFYIFLGFKLAQRAGLWDILKGILGKAVIWL